MIAPVSLGWFNTSALGGAGGESVVNDVTAGFGGYVSNEPDF